MSLGKGLESLIPHIGKKAADGDKPIFEPVFPASPAGGRRDDSLPVKPKKIHQPESVFQIEAEKIKPNPFQPRRDFGEAGLEELAQSIREFGIIQPLVVSKIETETATGTKVEYQLVAGERRLMAAKKIGLSRVPAIVKKIDFQRANLEMALIENLQRRDLNSLEQAKAYARLQDEFGLTQREIAARVGKSRETIANTLRLLNLPAQVQQALAEGRISEAQARHLLSVNNIQEQAGVFSRFVQSKTEPPKIPDPQQRYWEQRLEEKLGAPVKILKSGQTGRIVIQFHSVEEQTGLINKLLTEDNI